jgi:hypothetical protein
MTQTYTTETSIDAYRDDFLHREAVCRAAGTKRPPLIPIADGAKDVLAGIDAKQLEIRRVQDDLVRAAALEAAEKLDVIEAYEKARKQLAVTDQRRLFDFLPDAPSSMARYGVEKLTWYVGQAIKNLHTLPEDHQVRREFLPRLEQEFTEFKGVDVAEDEVRTNLAAMRLGMNAYKAELARIREEQLGSIQTVFGDRSKVELFTLPWRSAPRAKPVADAGSPPSTGSTPSTGTP